MTITDLSAHTSIVPFYFYAKDLECDFRGPNLTPPQFRRLNSCLDRRLVIWNFWGPDRFSRLGPLVIIPLEDIRPTDEQRAFFWRNLPKHCEEEIFNEGTTKFVRTPLLTYLLCTGLFAAEHTVGHQQPYTIDEDGNSWDQIWEFFMHFAQLSPNMDMEHP